MADGGGVVKGKKMQIYRMKKSLRLDEKRVLSQANIAPNLEYFRDRLIQERELSEQRRVLMEKYQWVKGLSDRFMYECLECGATTSQTTLDLESAKKEYPDEFIHAPDCAWDAALKDVGGE